MHSFLLLGGTGKHLFSASQPGGAQFCKSDHESHIIIKKGVTRYKLNFMYHDSWVTVVELRFPFDHVFMMILNNR